MRHPRTMMGRANYFLFANRLKLPASQLGRGWSPLRGGNLLFGWTSRRHVSSTYRIRNKPLPLAVRGRYFDPAWCTCNHHHKCGCHIRSMKFVCDTAFRARKTRRNGKLARFVGNFDKTLSSYNGINSEVSRYALRSPSNLALPLTHVTSAAAS